MRSVVHLSCSPGAGSSVCLPVRTARSQGLRDDLPRGREQILLRKNRSTTGVFYFFHYHTMCHYRITRRGCTLRHAIAVNERPNDGDDGVKRTVHWARMPVIPRAVRDPPTRGTSVGSAVMNHDRGITARNDPCRKCAARRPEPCFYRQTTWSSSRQRRIAWCTRYGTVRHARFKHIGRTRGFRLAWGRPGHTGWSN